ncbi:MAG: dicarboxylate/amino acid:cation symporter [Candidatus Omnitrophica bacterium]|nr:dicarboxylate/amino acid:cation symporter [Candidatus Omnitrophota bacterium]
MKINYNTQILISAIFGILFGVILTYVGTDSGLYSQSIYVTGIIGNVFISLLKMILIPLVFTSITVGIANLRAHAQMGKVWKLTLIYFLSTTSLSILLGLIVVNIFKPGVGLEISMFQDSMHSMDLQSLSIKEFIANFLSNLFVNPFEAMANGMVLPTIMFAIFLGVALIVLGEKAKTTLNLLNELFEIIMLIVSWIMKLLPIGIFALLTKLVATQDFELFLALGKFIFVVCGATIFHGFVTLPVILLLFSKIHPKRFYMGMRQALITAFSTSSSSATLPITYKCVTQELKIDKDIAGFVLPLGATINMDGTALYEAVAAIFIANLVGLDLNIVQQLIVFFMAILASIGAPGIPSAGMVTMVMVLQSVGLPAEAIAILYPIDRLLDALRTMINVEGDSVGCSVIHHFTQ